MWRSCLIVIFCVCVSTDACTLCPLRVPPRPRPLNQYKLPKMPEVNTETMPQFCNYSRSLPVEKVCRAGFEKIFCAADEALSSLTQCSGPENPAKCTKCAYKWRDNKWIIDWLDSLGKPAAGVSDGNYYWLGDYETCQALRESETFAGKYCRVEMEVPDALVEEGCPQTDPLAINLGVCFPEACSADQLTTVAQSISPYKLTVNCEFSDQRSPIIYLIVALGVGLISIQVYATFTSQYSREKTWYWMALSIRTNGSRALSTRRNVSGLHALHGLEFLTFFFIIIGNVYNYMQPYIENVAFSFDGVSSTVMHLTNNYSYQVDGLFALSALYTTYLLNGQLTTLPQALIAIRNRFVRFWPSYVICVMFMSLVFVHTASGPMWIHSDTVSRCASSWWKNILFINNFFPVRDTCLDFGYIVSLEAQYFCLLVFLIYLVRSHVLYAKILTIITLIASITVTFIRVYRSNLPPSPILTAEPIAPERIEELMDSVLLSFVCRISPYLIGFLFGICISPSDQTTQEETVEKKDILSKIQQWCILLICLCSALFVLFSLLPYASQSAGGHVFLALYAALHRPMWSFALLGLLYLFERGWFVWINAILSWRVFSPLSKLTWIALIVAEPVILYFFTALNRPAYATHWSTLYSAISAALLSYLIALMIDIFVARPIRAIFIEPDRQSIDQNTKHNNEEDHEEGTEMRTLA